MVAVSISVGEEPGGTYEGSFRSICQDCDGNCDVCETRAEPGELSVGDYVRWIVGDEVYFGEVYGLNNDEATVKIYDEEDGVLIEKDLIALVPISALEKIEAPMTEEPMDDEEEARAVDLTPPAYMRAAARQGLRYYEEGKGGDGLVERTIREARAMAEGNVTAEKAVRIRAWIARHLADLDAPDANPNSDGYPSAGVVAHLLWGSGPSKRSAQRALEYANGVIAKIEAENEGRAKGEALSKMETRLWVGNLEVRAAESGDGMTLTGYAALFNSWSEDLGGFREQIAPGAFKRSLKARNDIKMLWNHETGEVLGSTRSGTLRLTEDERGLRVEASLPDTQRGRDAKILIERGDVSGFSFGFSVAERGDTWNSEGNERTLKSVRLFEVSLTPFPAYTATNGTASVRGIDKLAKRSGVDPDALADAIIKVEEGKDLSPVERDLLVGAIDSLAPQTSEADGTDLLALKKKKLDLLKLMEGN
jgi:HK97 family phage prohead protease